MSGPTLIEVCAGAAAVSLHACGVEPPISWMGGKRRYADAILIEMGWPRDGDDDRWMKPGRLVWVEAGTWGWVWPILLDPVEGEHIVACFDEWEDFVRCHSTAIDGARALWDDLASSRPSYLPYLRAAQWLWLQARAASGSPVWWDDGWRMGEANGRERGMTQKGVNRQYGGGLVHPSTVARRIRALRAALEGVEVVVEHADARDVRVPPDAYVYIDPPYAGATGYECGLARPDVVHLAERLARERHGWRMIVVSEAEPLSLVGWHHTPLETPKNAKTEEWLTSWLTV